MKLEQQKREKMLFYFFILKNTKNVNKLHTKTLQLHTTCKNGT